ncbi:MAG: 50S ribosomal protein L11 methyltransferase [Deltaproteobacteria bacterium]
MASSPTPSEIAPDDRAHAALIREHTVVAAPFLVPEVRLHLVTPQCALWKATDADLERLELPAPYWAFGWAGGQAIARAILDGEIDVADKRVVDFGAGSGLIAIAAMLRGATCALAADVDPFAAIACRMNAALNGVTIETTVVDLVGREVNADVVFAGDVTYAADLAAAVRTWLLRLVAAGRRIYVGDPGRGFLDTEGLERVATIDAPSDVDVDGQYLVPTPIYAL